MLPISARSHDAVADVSRLMADWLESDGIRYTLEQIAGYAAHRKTHQECRAAVNGKTHRQWVEQLREIADSGGAKNGTRVAQSQIDKGVLFVCSGQGPQWWAMGRGLLTHDVVFRESIERCDREFAKYVSWSLIEELSRVADESRMQQTSIAQPSIFAIQVALAAVWAERGVRPAAVVGHSVGEIAAAYLSGALTWQDACCVAVHRGRTMDLATSKGGMIAAGLSAEESSHWIGGHEDIVALAAINSPTSVTISGDADAIETIAKKIKDAGIFCRHLDVEYAFHSPQMQPVRDPLLRCLANIRPQQTHTPIISTVTGRVAIGEEFDAGYWWRNVRHSVRFADAMQVVADANFGVVLEIGPHPVLAYSITECFQTKHKSVCTFPSLHRERDDVQCMTDSLGSLYSIGIDLDWDKLYETPRQRIPLPAYPFQRQRCWHESHESTVTRLAENIHPLLGESTNHVLPSWQNRIDLTTQNYLGEHRVRDVCMLPAAAMIEMAAEAARQVTHADSFTLERLQLQNPNLLTPDRPQHFETVYRADRRSISISARPMNDSSWLTLATVNVSGDTAHFDWDPESLADADEACADPFTRDRCYAYCKRLGLDYGKRFQGILRGKRRRGESIAEVDLNGVFNDPCDAYNIHPAVLDSCFHAMITADADFDHELGGLYLPSEIDRITFLGRVPYRVTTHVRLLSKDNERMVADIDILDDDGQPCVLLRGFVSQRVGAAEKSESVHDLIYRYQWLAAPESEGRKPDESESAIARRWCVLADQKGVADEAISSLRRCGEDVIRINHGSEFRKLDEQTFVVNPESIDDFKRLFRVCRDVDGANTISDIVYLWGLDAPSTDDLTTEQLDKSTILTTLAPMHLVQAWESLDENHSVRFAIVTRCAKAPINTKNRYRYRSLP